MHRTTIGDLIELFDLKPHLEGGYFTESYRSPEQIPGRGRNISTAIYFLLPQGTKSRLHRLASDEIWHFYLGGPMTLVQISPEGKMEEAVLGHDVKSGHTLQHVVKAGCWFGAFPNPGTEYSLVGCTVAPGFDFADLEIGKRTDLQKRFPHAHQMIEKLTD
jgi:uncharacterized protein